MTQTFYLDPTAGSNGSGTIGSPFDSMFHAWAGIATAFNAATEDYEVICLAGEDTNAGQGAGDPVILDPTNASATARVLRFIASGANRHTGVRGTGYRLPAQITNNTANANVTVELNGIAFKGTTLDRSFAVTMRVWNCLSYDAGGNGINCGGGTINLKNTAIIGATFHGVASETSNGTPVIDAINNTSVGAQNSCSGFIAQFGGTLNATNNYAGNNAGADFSGATLTGSTNLSEDGSQSTSTAAYSTATFTSVTGGSENLKLAAGSALIGAGVGPGSNGSVPTDDFEGDARSGATTDVGFDQRTAAGGSGISVAWLRA